MPTILYTRHIKPLEFIKCLNQRVVVCAPPSTLLLAWYSPAIAPGHFLELHKYSCMYKTHHITSPGSEHPSLDSYLSAASTTNFAAYLALYSM